MTNDTIKIKYEDGIYEIIQEKDMNGVLTINKDGKFYAIMSMSIILNRIAETKHFTDNLIDCDKLGEVTEDNKESWGF